MTILPLTRELQARLLGRRTQSVLQKADRRLLAGQRIMITGAGGSVGSELARQIATCRPARLVLLDHTEYALFRIERELRARHPRLDFDVVMGDVSRRTDVRLACTALRPHVIYHAAAYKHITMTERAVLPAIRTNVLGTVETATAARGVGARFVLISSDKAAQPSSVMGATKRLAELAALSLASSAFRPVAVRFGNILGSSGSLVEIMRDCVQEGRSIPLTHPDATRFFMTAEEAVSLVLKADLIGQRAQVFWLDMGKPVRIGDLAERFVACAVADGFAAVGIEIIGLRAGEKMYEELATQGMAMRSTEHPRIWSARQRRASQDVVASAVRALRRAVAAGDSSGALDVLQATVPDFIASPSAVSAARTGRMALTSQPRRTRALRAIASA